MGLQDQPHRQSKTTNSGHVTENLLDQEDGNCEFYDLSDVTLRLVQ